MKAKEYNKQFNELLKTETIEKSIYEIFKNMFLEVKEIQKMESAKDKLEEKGQKMLNQNNDIFDRVDGLLDKAKNAAKELGVKPESITNYKKAESLINKLVIANITRDLQDNGYF